VLTSVVMRIKYNMSAVLRWWLTVLCKRMRQVCLYRLWNFYWIFDRFSLLFIYRQFYVLAFVSHRRLIWLLVNFRTYLVMHFM